MTLAHEDMFAHAIWTFPVVSLLVVADHRRHHSLESEQVEARVAEITCPVSSFNVPLFLNHQLVMELEAILVVGQAVLAIQEVLEVPEVH